MTPTEYLQTASDTVRDRSGTHGAWQANLTGIAALWTAYLGHEVKASDVAAMMVLLKLSRAKVGRYVPDHGVDAAGYAGLWGAMAEREADPAHL